MRFIAVTCILSFCFVPIHCAKRGPPPLPPQSENYKILVDPNEYFQSDEPHTDVPPVQEHDTEPSVHVIESHVPDAPIQQYVNPWGGPYFPWNSSPFGSILRPPPFEPQPPFGAQPPFGSQPPFEPQPPPPPPGVWPSPGLWSPPGVWPPYGPITEYGILVPDVEPHHPPHHHNSPPQDDLMNVLKDVVPRNIVFMLAKWSAFIVSLFSIVAFGGIVTTALCSFTSYCTISFASLPFAALRNSIASKQDENGNIDRVRRAVQFVSSAIEKYDKLQQTVTARKSKTEQH